MTPHQIDSWQSTVKRRIRQVTQTVLQLINDGNDTTAPSGHVYAPNRTGECRDCGEGVKAHQRRPASSREKEATYRHGDAGDTATKFHYNPTPPGSSRQPIWQTNTVLNTVTRWETDVEQAVTRLVGTAGEVDAFLQSLGINHPAPDEPATRTTLQGRTIACTDPATARHIVVTHAVWLTQAFDLIAERMRISEDTAERAHYLERLTHVLARQVGVYEERICEKRGCTRTAPPGRGRICRACEQADARARSAS